MSNLDATWTITTDAVLARLSPPG